MENDEIIEQVKKGIGYIEINGKKEGKWIERYKNGNKKAEAIYKDGGLVDKVEYDEKTKRKKDGKVKEKDEDGEEVK